MADEVKIPIFDGKDYECWKRRITMILRLKKCKVVAKRERARTDNEDEWNEKDLKAINVIYSGISNDRLQFIKDKEITYEIMKKFDEMYLKESTALQICVRNKLQKLKLKDFKNSSDFFTEFEKLVNELSADANVTEKEKLSYTIKILPRSLTYVGDLIDVLKESDQTVEYVKSKIKIAELKEKEEGSKNSSSAFKAQRRKGKVYFKCGKFEHFKARCMSLRPGEILWKSREGMQQQGGRRQQQQHWHHRGSSNRVAGRDSSQHHRGTGWWQNHGQLGQQHEEGPNNFCIEIEEKPELNDPYVEVISCIGKVEWLLDSGCSDHTVNNDTVKWGVLILGGCLIQNAGAILICILK